MKTMELLPQETTFKIQKYIAIISSIMGIGVIVLNIVDPHDTLSTIINISTTTGSILLMFLSFWWNKKVWKLVQVVIIFLTGLFALVFDSRTRLVGEVIIIVATLLLFPYRIIKITSYKPVVVISILMLAIKGISGIIRNGSSVLLDLLLTGFAITLLFLTVFILNREFTVFLNKAKEIETFSRAGIQIYGLTHALGIGNIMTQIYGIITKIERKKYDEALHKLGALTEELKIVDSVRHSILMAAEMRNKKTKVIINVHEVIDLALNFSELQLHEKISSVNIVRNYTEKPFKIKIVPHEFFLILQNILSNAVESILKTNKKGEVVVSTHIIENQGEIRISDTGTGFKFDKTQGVILKSEKSFGGYGLYYIIQMLKYYNASIKFYNMQRGGAEISIKIPIQKVEVNNEEIFIKID